MQFIRAKKAVVSNASMWDTLNLLPKEAVTKAYQERIRSTPKCESFMHLHLGFDAEVGYLQLSGYSWLALFNLSLNLDINLEILPQELFFFFSLPLVLTRQFL